MYIALIVLGIVVALLISQLVCRHDWSVWTPWLSWRYREFEERAVFFKTRRCFKCSKEQKVEIGDHPCDTHKCNHWDVYRPQFSKEESLKELDRRRAETIKQLEESLL